jgi:hypothetical protein
LLRPADNWLDVADIECIQDPPDVGTRISTALGTWLAASVLPTYTETIEVKPPTWCGERLFSLFTTYNELKHATLDSQYESVFVRLQMEWTYVGGLVCARPSRPYIFLNGPRKLVALAAWVMLPPPPPDMRAF